MEIPFGRLSLSLSLSQIPFGRPIQLHADIRGFNLPIESVNYLLKRVERNVSSLVEIIKILDYESLSNEKANVEDELHALQNDHDKTLDDLKSSETRLSAVSEAYERRINNLEKELDTTTEELDSKIRSLDDELNALREKLQGGVEAVALPSADFIEGEKADDSPVNEVQAVKVSEVDNELEEMKRSIDNK